MKSYIVVVGSSNTDMVVKAERLPGPGETVLGGEFLMAAGGKGANQAVAAARLGADVCLIAKVGQDIFGRQAIDLFSREGIETGSIIVDAGAPSGVALINVDARGENCIVVASGANARLMPADVAAAADKITNAALILMQLEIPLPTVEFVAELARRNNVPVVLNPAPARELTDDLLAKISILVPNQKEAEMLSGVRIADKAAAGKAARALAAKGVAKVIITMGAQGALLLESDIVHWVPSPAVTAVDTTAAGDVFCGALAVAIAEGKPLKEAVEAGCAAAALSVTKMGALTSAPTRAELDRFYQ
ncbi:MAG TPA: ribokinase [Puia sp.]|nr:ribokinase [Puia sp.]